MTKNHKHSEKERLVNSNPKIADSGICKSMKFAETESKGISDERAAKRKAMTLDAFAYTHDNYVKNPVN